MMQALPSLRSRGPSDEPTGIVHTLSGKVFDGNDRVYPFHGDLKYHQGILQQIPVNLRNWLARHPPEESKRKLDEYLNGLTVLPHHYWRTWQDKKRVMSEGERVILLYDIFGSRAATLLSSYNEHDHRPGSAFSYTAIIPPFLKEKLSRTIASHPEILEEWLRKVYHFSPPSLNRPRVKWVQDRNDMLRRKAE